ncbi:hypothetical protein RND81_06G181000 [Saponaria officinalis]|uniref:Uncharacterized protein n=1 Tax=Saponaria officinalis TaxID=3572 RepID=A0AAW1KCX8_SAPOF
MEVSHLILRVTGHINQLKIVGVFLSDLSLIGNDYENVPQSRAEEETSSQKKTKRNNVGSSRRTRARRPRLPTTSEDEPTGISSSTTALPRERKNRNTKLSTN